MPESDLYGVDVRLTDDGDLAVAPDGSVIDAAGPVNCAQALVLRMRCWPTELALHPNYGSTLERRLIGAKGDPDLGRSAANAELRAAIESDRRFLSAREIAATINPDRPNILAISLKLRLADGDELDVTNLADLRADEILTVDPALLAGDDALLDSEDTFLADDGDDFDELPDIEILLDDALILGA